jgi:hypothetical protein
MFGNMQLQTDNRKRVVLQVRLELVAKNLLPHQKVLGLGQFFWQRTPDKKGIILS